MKTNNLPWVVYGYCFGIAHCIQQSDCTGYEKSRNDQYIALSYMHLEPNNHCAFRSKITSAI